MSVKKIRLRGISNVPSERTVVDGCCSDSVNMVCDGEDIIPVCPPTPKTDTGVPSDTKDDILFIHKTKDYEHYVGLRISGASHILGWYSSGAFKAIHTLSSGESVTDVSAVGNTLLVMTNLVTHYFLYKEDGYYYLGDRIPSPHLDFINFNYGISSDRVAGSAETKSALPDRDEGALLTSPISSLGPDYFKEIPRSEQAIDAPDGTWKYAELTDEKIYVARVDIDDNAKLFEKLKLVVSELISYNAKRNLFCFPVFVRYSVRLYDGSYVNSSVPLLMQFTPRSATKGEKTYGYYIPWGNDPYRVYFKHDNVINRTGNYRYYNISSAVCALREIFSVSLRKRLKESEFTSWHDIVKGIDVFVSANINLTSTRYIDYSISSIATGQSVLSFGSKCNADDILDALQDKSNFYLLKSFDIDRYETLPTDRYTVLTKEDISQDALATSKRLDAYDTGYDTVISPSHGMNVNNRIIAYDFKRYLNSGYFALNGAMYANKPDQHYYVFKYYVRTSDGRILTVLARNAEGGTHITEPDLVTGSSSFHMSYGSWIAYGDSRCFKAEIGIVTYDGTRKTKTYTMREHTALNCAFNFLGFGVSLYDDLLLNGESGEVTETEEYLESVKNLLCVYDSSNPFVVRAANQISVGSGGILNIGVATKALSEGQFGAHDLYVFTDQGIYALEPAADGTYLRADLVSREVLTSANALTPLDNSIVFVTDKSVMLLSGSQISDIAPYMSGKNYQVGEDALNALYADNVEWRIFASDCNAVSSFMSFMKGSVGGYDYNGARIIFYNKDYEYQYALKLGDNSWHRIHDFDAAGGALFFKRVLNSYPGLYVSVASESDGGLTKIYDYSTDRGTFDDASVLSGLVVTRPMDFGSPDCLKMIHDLRIRGDFRKGSVKYVLLASNDGLTYKRVRSLIAGSAKYYRMIIVSRLRKSERISYVEFDIEERWLNRLR